MIDTETLEIMDQIQCSERAVLSSQDLTGLRFMISRNFDGRSTEIKILTEEESKNYLNPEWREKKLAQRKQARIRLEEKKEAIRASSEEAISLMLDALDQKKQSL